MWLAALSPVFLLPVLLSLLEEHNRILPDLPRVPNLAPVIYYIPPQPLFSIGSPFPEICGLLQDCQQFPVFLSLLYFLTPKTRNKEIRLEASSSWMPTILPSL